MRCATRSRRRTKRCPSRDSSSRPVPARSPGGPTAADMRAATGWMGCCLWMSTCRAVHPTRPPSCTRYSCCSSACRSACAPVASQEPDMPEQLVIAFWLWVAGLVLALARSRRLARVLIAVGAADGIWGAVIALPQGGSVVTLPITLADQVVRLRYAPEALWLLGFGLLPAGLAGALATPIRKARSGWLAGAALSLIGALGVFGLQDAYSFLIAWELMSIGGAVMILSER